MRWCSMNSLIASLTCTPSTGGTAPPRILGLLDFEMATVGDPLVDLARAMIFWPEEGNLIAFPPVDVPGGFDAAFARDRNNCSGDTPSAPAAT